MHIKRRAVAAHNAAIQYYSQTRQVHFTHSWAFIAVFSPFFMPSDPPITLHGSDFTISLILWVFKV